MSRFCSFIYSFLCGQDVTSNDNTVNCEIVLDRAGGSNGMHIGTEILNKSSHMSLK